MNAAQTRLTYADYLETSDDERYELLDGELVMAPAPRTAHQIITMELGSLLHLFVKERGLGRALAAPTDVVSCRTPMWCMSRTCCSLSHAREDIITPDNIQGAPDLVVDILSPDQSRA